MPKRRELDDNWKYLDEVYEKPPSDRRAIIKWGEYRRILRLTSRMHIALRRSTVKGHWYKAAQLARMAMTASDNLFRLSEELEKRG